MRVHADGLCTSSGCSAAARNRGLRARAAAACAAASLRPAPVAFDHARGWMGPLGTRVWSVGWRLVPVPGTFTMRMERGVGLRPPNANSLGPPPVEEWKVEPGAGGGGRLGSQEG